MSAGAFLKNLKAPVPLRLKLYLLLRNTGIKVSRRQSCCGHPGEPGC
ncbi:MAG: hypothetical protein HYX96_04765 [Chloroflexi bacterium]|nr:hypothetical protein [Chloroflexota bacterium]